MFEISLESGVSEYTESIPNVMGCVTLVGLYVAESFAARGYNEQDVHFVVKDMDWTIEVINAVEALVPGLAESLLDVRFMTIFTNRVKMCVKHQFYAHEQHVLADRFRARMSEMSHRDNLPIWTDENRLDRVSRKAQDISIARFMWNCAGRACYIQKIREDWNKWNYNRLMHLSETVSMLRLFYEPQSH